MLNKLKFSTDNEEKDYSVEELTEVFNKNGFVCDLKHSYSTIKRPKNLFSFIPMVKYILYSFVKYYIPFINPINRGDCLILRMKFINNNFNS